MWINSAIDRVKQHYEVKKCSLLTVRNSKPPLFAIIDNFVEDIGVQRDFHYTEAERLRGVIEDATARLGNHKTALEACERVLETVRVEQALTISHLDIMPELGRVA